MPSGKNVSMFLLKQVFRSPGDSHVFYVDLGIYSSLERMKEAAKVFFETNPPHPDTPYHIYAWPCVVDQDAHDLEKEVNTLQGEKGFYVVF